MSKKAVMVFSGGQDSTTCLIQALPLYDEVHCITFDYGQRHVAEIEVAQQLARQLGATVHKVMDVSLLNELAISSLTRDNIPVPTVNSSGERISSSRPPMPSRWNWRDCRCLAWRTGFWTGCVVQPSQSLCNCLTQKNSTPQNHQKYRGIG